jgi:FKBP-type peptidyl-prolyl cis-trans isomerase FklB
MKRILIIALAVLASASFSPVDAGKRKKKQVQQEPVAEVQQPVQLLSASDSVSYAGGMMLTDGLMPYLIQQFSLDTACVADFVAGFREAAQETTDPHVKARRAGWQIAERVRTGMLPRMVADFSGTADSIVADVLLRGFTDGVMADSTVMQVAQAHAFFMERQQYNERIKAQRLAQPGVDFLAANARRDSVITTPSGLQYKVLVQGTGEVPQATDRVKVNYEGRLIDGTIFDASSAHGNAPAVFAANQVISGWTEALTMMPVGSKWELYIPYTLAYGDRQMGQIPAYSALIFQVELVGIER